MEDPITRIKMDSVKELPNGAVAFEVETVPYKQAFDEAMINTQATLARMYKANPEAFKFIILNLADNDK